MVKWETADEEIQPSGLKRAIGALVLGLIPWSALALLAYRSNQLLATPQEYWRIIHDYSIVVFVIGAALGWMSLSAKGKSGGLRAWAIVVALLAIVTNLGGAVVVYSPLASRFEVAAGRQVDYVKTEMRDVETALMKYQAQNHTYPAWSTGKLGANTALGNRAPLWAVPTFRLSGSPLATLTTPIAFLDSYPIDPFSQFEGVQGTFSYYADKEAWILVSPGPNRTLEIDPIKAVRSGPAAQAYLLERTYDPTNGTRSQGDLYRQGGF